jgi:hypothetical protein
MQIFMSSIGMFKAAAAVADRRRSGEEANDDTMVASLRRNAMRLDTAVSGGVGG